jgi:hypothetical protein
LGCAGENAENEYRSQEPRGCRGKRLSLSEDAVNAGDQFWTALPCAERESTERESLLTPGEVALSQTREAGGIGARSVGRLDDVLIAGDFPLGAKAALGPHEGWVEREKHETQFLEQVGPVVAALEVSGFVEQNLLQLFRSERA